MATGWPMKVTYANGDVYSASDVNDTNGTINLLTSSTLSYSGGKNGIINGGMDIWQRGTSFVHDYTADRWYYHRTFVTGSTVTRQVAGSTLPEFLYCLRNSRDSGTTNLTAMNLSQSMESQQSYRFAGKTVTLSFWARKGANYSATGSALGVYIITGTGVDQNAVFSGYTGQINQNTTVTLTTSWQRFTYTVAIGSTATEICPLFNFVPTGTAGAADYYEITGVQLELGSSATTFSRAGGTIAGELAACQRYYILIATDEGTRKNLGIGSYYSTTQINGFIYFPVTMRTPPTLVATSGTDYYGCDRAGGSDYFNSLTIYRPSPNSCMVYNASEANGTTGQSGQMYTNGAFTVVSFSAEF